MGYTLKQEGMAWITPRGGTRPVLAWAAAEPGGELTNITVAEARKAYALGGLGFTSITLWSSTEMLNATYVEDRLQQRYHELDLPRRLHRRCGAGANSSKKPEVDEQEVHQVFLTYSFDVAEAIREGKVALVD